MNNITINSNSNDIKEMEKLFPRAPLKIIAMEGCKELGQKVNDYIVNFRQSSYREELKSPIIVDLKGAMNNFKIENKPVQKQRRVLLFENENLDLEQRGNKYYLSLYDTIGRFKKEVTIDMKDDILEILSREDCYGNI